MPTVRCPSCQRALRLPEHADIRSAQCPLCKTTFDVPAQPEPEAAVPVSLLPQVDLGPRTFDQPGRRPLPPEDFPFRFEDEEKSPLSGADSLALGSARGWLKSAAAAGLADSFSCGCCSAVFALDALPRHFGSPGAVLVCVLVVRLIGFSLMWSASASLEHRRNFGLAMAGAVSGLFMSLLQTFFLCLGVRPLLFLSIGGAEGLHSDGIFIAVCLVISLVVLVLSLVGSMKTLSVLRIPTVRAAFRRRPAL